MPKCSNSCNKKGCVFFRKAEIPAVVANDDITPPRNGDFCNMLVVYEATGNAYLFASDGIPTLLSSNDYRKLSHLPSINGVTIIGDLTLSDIGVTQLVEEEADARRDADNDLQEQIDTIAASSDVVDIVGTYQELMQYDTSHLTINDVIKVLDDETENDATTYYRWTNDGWLFIGQEGPYYTKSQVNELLDGKLDDDALDDYYDKTETDALLADKADVSDLAAKQDKLIAGTNITIDQATNTISATVPSLDNYYTKQETYSQTEVNNLISGVEADIPTATSQLTNDSGFLTTLPIATSQILGGIKVGSGLSVTPDGTLSADAQHIDIDTALSTTSTNPVENRVITNALNDKANLSDIPTVPTNVSAFYNDAGYVTSSTIAQNYYNKTETYTQTEVDNLISGVSADIPTKTSDLTNDGATGTSTYVELNQLATVATSGSYNDLTDKPTVMTGLVEMSYGEANAWAKFIAAYQAKQIVYCRASSAANPASGSQTRKAFMAYVNNAGNPTSVEFQYVRSVSSKTASQPVDQVFVYTLTSANGGTWTVTARDMGPKLAQGTNTTVSYSNGTYTISATQPTVPTKTSDLTNDGSDGTSTYVETDQLATVATSGSYNDLSNKPTIPAAQVNSDWNASSGVAQILNKPTLATVATSGSYNDLSNKPNIPTVNNATLTIQKNGTTVNTFTANASSNVTANITVPTKTSELTNDSSFVTSSGTVAKADQLTTPRTIAISGGVTGTATSFSGASNISIPVTYVRDSYTIWGGKDLVSDISPDDAGCTDEFGHNKLAFLPAECIEVKYSTDGGTTWTDYGLTDAQKIALVTTTGPGIGAGKSATITASNIANMRGRVRIACGTMAKSGKIYTALKKILINFSTNGATNTKIRIRRRTIANYLSGTETWEDLGTHNIGGWSGWNSYPYSGNFGGNMNSQTGQPGQIEFEFWGETFNSSYGSRCSLSDIRFIGTTNWTMPSELARAGHLYTYDTSQNATFPANVKVTGSLQHGNYTYTLPSKNGTVAMTSDIPSVPTVNNGQLTIQKNGTNVATFTANASSNVTADISVPTLYTTTGQNTDGAVTQKLFTDTVGNVETILQTLNNGGGAQ